MAELLVPTVTDPKLIELVESVTGALPVPLRLTVCGLFAAASVKVSVPVAAPVAAGVKVTPTVQVAPAATLLPQVLLAIVKWAVAAMLVKLSAVVSWLVRVTVLDELVLPTTTVPKLKLLADRVTGCVPVPVRLTFCGLVKALSTNVSVPLSAPRIDGVKVTPTVQVAPAAIPAPQVLLAMA